MLNRTPFTLSICSLLLFTTANVIAMTVTDPKKAVTQTAATPNNAIDSKAAALDISGKEEKKIEAQVTPEVIVRQLEKTIIFTAPQPKIKMCTYDETIPPIEILNDPAIRNWYEIDDEQHPETRNQVLRTLTETVMLHFANNVFPRFEKDMSKILVAFDIDETALTFFAYFYTYYTTPSNDYTNPYTRILSAACDCGANQPILNLYNFFKRSGCTVVFTSSRQATAQISENACSIDIQPLMCKGLNIAGYVVDEKDVHLCSGFFKKEKRAELVQQNGYEYVVAIDDDFYVINEDDTLDCGVWVPSAHHYDEGYSDAYYTWLKELAPDPTAKTIKKADDPNKLNIHML